VNDKFVEQLVAMREGGHDKADEMGVIRPQARGGGRPQLWGVHDGEPAGAPATCSAPASRAAALTIAR